MPLNKETKLIHKVGDVKSGISTADFTLDFLYIFSFFFFFLVIDFTEFPKKKKKEKKKESITN